MKERMKRKPFLQPCCLVLAQKKSKYYSSISCLGTGKVEILQYYLTACRAFVTRLQTEKSKYHNTISRHAAPLVAINKYKSQNLSLTKYFITTLLKPLPRKFAKEVWDYDPTSTIRMLKIRPFSPVSKLMKKILLTKNEDFFIISA
jgi:hypothetical protein